MEMIFHSHANKSHFHKKGCALGLILKVRVFGTRKWPIHLNIMRSTDRLIRTPTALKPINGEEPPLSCCSDLYSCSLAFEDIFHCHVLRYQRHLHY